MGRFITEDPIKDGSNYYIYCQNNPLTRIDPTGLSWENNVPAEYREDVVARSGDEKAQKRMKDAKDYSDDDEDEDEDNEPKMTEEEKVMAALSDLVNDFMESILESAQTLAMLNSNYKRGSDGPLNFVGADENTTWCNQATYAIAKVTGLSLDIFKNNSSDDINLIDGNDAARNLEANVNNPDLNLVKVDSSVAGNLASIGITVIAASENPNGRGHLSTVSTNQTNATKGNPVIANVGWKNGEMTADKAFNNRSVNYYYDRSQFFNYKPDYEYNIGDSLR